MKHIKVLMSGLPGKMALACAELFAREPEFSLLPVSLTGPGVPEKTVSVGDAELSLSPPETHRQMLGDLKKEHESFIVVDYTHPSAVNENAKLYTDLGVPFVMGTTGGDRKKLLEQVEGSGVPAVIAPNMAREIVGFTAMMKYAAKHFPGLFEGYSMTLVESHQKGKADTSGTAKAMVEYFNRMGVAFDVEEIEKIRDPEVQKTRLGVPEEHLSGHGWHTYTLRSPDKTVLFSFTHNVNGREVYARGTAEAVRFLAGRVARGDAARVYSMIDVLEKA
ncbi:MAG: dihydrodipicolinate reductase [Deltaproteobacteria bacterium]|nr:dihydrodipicolinate reductase [Deltaproteobacteria bacterium]